MNKKLLSLLLILVFLLQACASAVSPLPSATDTPGLAAPISTTTAISPTSVLTPTPEATNSPTPLPEPTFAAAGVASLEGLDSYTIVYYVSSADFQQNGPPITLEVLPKAFKAHYFYSGIDFSQRYSETDLQSMADARNVSLDSLKNEMSQYHLYWISRDQVLQNYLGGWRLEATAGSYLNFKYYTHFAGFSDLLSWLVSAKYTGDEMVNGIASHHFIFDQSDLDPSQAPPGMVVSQASGEFDLSSAGNYPVHLKVSLQGQHLYFNKFIEGIGDAPIESGSGALVVDLVAVNTLSDIPLPEQAQVLFPQVDWPLPPDAILTEVYELMAGILNIEYQSDLSVQQVVDSIKAEAQKTGWSVAVMPVPGTSSAMLGVGKDDFQKYYDIRPDPDTGKTVIEIH